MKILVAMSGGVDSSVTAYLLREQGHEIVGATFTLWSDPLAPPLAKILPSKCCNAQTAARCRAVTKDLGIDLHVINLEREFKRQVVDPFLNSYKTGKTPNPCVGCNRTIKFGELIKQAKRFGCNKVATGHYARVLKESSKNKKDRYLLLEALDKSKDQSYYLNQLSQAQLSKVMFPLGALYKKDVFKLAKKFGVPYDAKTYIESQDLCFFPEKEPTEFLKRHLKKSLKPGPIKKRDGTVLGQHKGLALYTVGQRRLGVGGQPIPLEVVAKNTKCNELIVALKSEEKINEVIVKDIRWISDKPKENKPITYECRLRSLAPRQKGILKYLNKSGTVTFKFSLPTQAAGQSIVFYKGEEIVGGGIMA